MAHYQAYECPECLGQFRFLHHPDDEPPPRFCPLCGVNLEDDPPDEAFIPAVPHIARSIGRSADQVYRAMESSSEANAQAVASITGGDAADVSAMKITNLSDYLRPGDVAAKMPVTPVTQNMKGQGGFQPLMNMTGAEFAAQTSQGLFPHSGEATRQFITSGHSQRARQTQRNGELGRHKAK